MSVKVPLTLALLPFVVSPVLADKPQLKWISDWKDVQFYIKPKYNLISTWAQEFGIQATVFKFGQLSESVNFDDEPTYPIRSDQKPKFAFAFQETYNFTNVPFKIGIYTKTKAALPYTWKQESGFTARLYTSRSMNISANIAYLFTYPFSSSAKPQWVALVSFQFPLH